MAVSKSNTVYHSLLVYNSQYIIIVINKLTHIHAPEALYQYKEAAVPEKDSLGNPPS